MGKGKTVKRRGVKVGLPLREKEKVNVRGGPLEFPNHKKP